MEGSGALATRALLLLFPQSILSATYDWRPGTNCVPYDQQKRYWCCTGEHCSDAENENGMCPEVPVLLANSCNGKCYHDYDFTFVAACENSTICLENLDLCSLLGKFGLLHLFLFLFHLLAAAMRKQSCRCRTCATSLRRENLIGIVIGQWT